MRIRDKASERCSPRMETRMRETGIETRCRVKELTFLRVEIATLETL